MKPGYLTTEFLLTALTLLCATGALIAGAIDTDRWLLIFTGSNGFYALSRGVSKVGPVSKAKTTPKAPVD